jgi:hypothetical protein
MKIRALLAGIALATGVAATAGSAHAGAWTASLNGEGSCEPAPRTATDTWVVTWVYTNTEDSSDHAFITAESDQHSGDQQLIGHELASGQGGFLVVSYPASAASDTLSVTFTWKNDDGSVADHKTVTATVQQPSGCTVYASPAVPAPTWQALFCGGVGGVGSPIPASFTTTAVTGVHYDDVIDGVHYDNQPAGKHIVVMPGRDVTVYVQAWDDTSGALIQQWSHTFTYHKCIVVTHTATLPGAHSQPVAPAMSSPSTHRPASTPAKSPAAARHVNPALHAAATAGHTTPSSTATQLASTGTSYPAGKAALIGLAAVLAGLGLISGGWFMTRTRRSH